MFKRILRNTKLTFDEQLPTVLIDDNEKYLKSCGYDITVNVSHFFSNLNDANNYFVEYHLLLKHLQNQISKWWTANKNILSKFTTQIVKKTKCEKESPIFDLHRISSDAEKKEDD